jgi:hypothetical protein
MLQEPMAAVHLDHSLEAAVITLEKHVPGRSTVRMLKQYRQGKIPVQREYEGVFKLVFNPRTRDLTVKEASFNYTLNHIRGGFWRIERGIQFRTPPLIPREHRDPMDPKGLLMEPSTTRYPDYTRKPRLKYTKEGDSSGIYVQSPRGLYTRTRKERRELAS